MSTDEKRLQFPNMERQHRSVLIYCDVNFSKYLYDLDIEYYDVKYDADMSILRDLDTPYYNTYRLLLCTDANVGMRGVDYRSPGVGITLCVLKSCTCNR